MSDVIADLVMEHVEVTALSTYASPSRWWRRYVDDSNTCLKSNEKFHHLLNSLNPHIEFTVERASKTNGQPTIPFLDTEITFLPNGSIDVQVYRKPTHTDKYLQFNSNYPAQHKRSVVSALLSSADVIYHQTTS